MERKFEEVYAINVNDRTEQKDGLTYLSWAWAWAEFKKIYPDATYDIIKDEDYKCYFGDERTGYMVYTAVLADGIRHEMWLPVLDSANKAMKREPYTYEVKNKNFKYATFNSKDGKYYDKYGNEQTEFTTKKVEAMSMFDVNKTIMRCLTKNLAMFGLGLYIYAGEDLPEDDSNKAENAPKTGQRANVDKFPAQKKETPQSAKGEAWRLTASELVTKYEVDNAEKVFLYYEKALGDIPRAEWDEETTEIVRKDLAKRQAQKLSKKRLESVDGDLPFKEVEE